MTNTEIRNTLNSPDYSFLRENPHLGNKTNYTLERNS